MLVVYGDLSRGSVCSRTMYQHATWHHPLARIPKLLFLSTTVRSANAERLVRLAVCLWKGMSTRYFRCRRDISKAASFVVYASFFFGRFPALQLITGVMCCLACYIVKVRVPALTPRERNTEEALCSCCLLHWSSVASPVTKGTPPTDRDHRFLRFLFVLHLSGQIDRWLLYGCGLDCL